MIQTLLEYLCNPDQTFQGGLVYSCIEKVFITKEQILTFMRALFSRLSTMAEKPARVYKGDDEIKRQSSSISNKVKTVLSIVLKHLPQMDLTEDDFILVV